MAVTYVGICKKYTNIFNMAKFCHLEVLAKFYHLEKMGPNGTSISCLNCWFVIFTILTPTPPTHHNPQPLSHYTHNPPTQASNNSPQWPATHTSQITLHNFPQLPTPPTFGNEDDEGYTNLNVPGAPGMSVNTTIQPSSSPNRRRRRPRKCSRFYRWPLERRLMLRGGRDSSTGAMGPSPDKGGLGGSCNCHVGLGGHQCHINETVPILCTWSAGPSTTS